MTQLVVSLSIAHRPQMFAPAATCLAVALDIVDARGDTITSRAAQRRERLADPVNFYRAQTQTYIVPSEFPLPTDETPADITIRRLLSLADLPENWDGAGAAKPSRESVEHARNFIRALSLDSLELIPTLHANGDALLLHRNHPYAEVEFASDGSIMYYATDGAVHVYSDEDEKFDDASIPAKLRAIGIS